MIFYVLFFYYQYSDNFLFDFVGNLYVLPISVHATGMTSRILYLLSISIHLWGQKNL